MRLTIKSTGGNGYALDLDNPQNELEARKQLMEKFKIAVNKLAEFENFMEEYGFESIDDLKEEEILHQFAEKDKEIEVQTKFIIDLQKEIKNYRNKLYNFDLDTLKGKKIDKKSYLKGFSNCEQQFASQMPDIEKELRHQVCEEIRNAIKQAELKYEWKGETTTIEEVLDQIEKGGK